MADEIGSVKIKVGMDISDMQDKVAASAGEIEAGFRRAGKAVQQTAAGMRQAMSGAGYDQSAVKFMEAWDGAKKGTVRDIQDIMDVLREDQVEAYKLDPAFAAAAAKAGVDTDLKGDGAARLEKQAAAADTLGKKLEAAEAELEKLSAAGMGPGEEQWDRAYQAAAQLRAEVKAYLADLAKTPAQRAKEEDAAARTAARVEEIRQKEEAKAAAARRAQQAADFEAQVLAEVAAQAEVADERIAAMARELEQLKARQATLTAAGVGVGYAEYDANAERIREITEALAEYQRRSDDVGQSAGMWAVASGAVSKFGGILAAAVGVLKKAGSALGSLASKAASVAKQIGGGILGAVKSLAAAVGRLFAGNGKLSNSVGGLTSSLKKLVPALLAARGIMGILRKAVNAYMDANVQVAGQLSACWSSLGNILGPIIQRLVDLVAKVTSYVVAFLRLLGLTASASTSAMEGAGGAAKKLKQQLSGLDEIHTWQEDSSGGGGGGSTGQMQLPEVELSDWTKRFADALKKAWMTGEGWKEAADMLAEKLNEMVANVDWAGIGTRLGKKMAGVLAFLAEFIRKFDFTALFLGLFTLIRNAIAELDPADIGVLLALKFILIFSALRAMVDSGIIPVLAQKISGSIEGFFVAIREKFATEANANGWTEVGNTISDAIISILDGIRMVLEDESMWDEMIQDISAFFDGLKLGEIWDHLLMLLKAAAEKVPWKDMLGALLRFAVQILVFFREKILGIPSSEVSRPWNDLKDKLAAGDNIEWIDILSGLAAFLADIINTLVDMIPDGGFEELWNDLKDKLAAGLTGGGSWEDLKEQLQERVIDVLAAAFDNAGDAIYEIIKSKSDLAANILFPGRYQVDKAAQNFKGYLVAGSIDAATSQLNAMVANHDITVAEAQRLAAEAGYAYADGMLTALPDVEDSAKEVVTAAAVSLEDLTAECQQRMNESGRAAVIEYLQGFVDAGQITGDQAAEIVRGLAESVASATEMYIFEFEQGGAEAAAAYLQGLVDAGELTAEQAAEVVAAAAEAMGGDTSDFQAAGAEAAESYSAGLEGAGGDVTAAANTLREAARGPVKLLREDVAGELAGMETDISDAYGNMESSVSDGSSGMNDSNYSSWEAIRSQVDRVADLIKVRTRETWKEMERTSANSGKAIQETNKATWTAVQTSVQTSLTAAGAAATQSFQAMQSGAASFGASVNQTMTSSMSTLRSTMQSTFSTLATSAVNWGRDICSKLSSGIRTGISNLASAASSAASSIRSYLHFSVPDKGPLADADTYMPDMMRLLADTMEKSAPVAARAAGKVAEGIRGELDNGAFAVRQIDMANPLEGMEDSMVASFADMLERMQALADNVTFTAPAVAMGGVVPYNTAIAGERSGAAGNGEGDMAELISLLKQYIRPGQSAQSGESRVSVNVKGRTLFDVVLEEGRAARKSTGRNPFTEL